MKAVLWLRGWISLKWTAGGIENLTIHKNFMILFLETCYTEAIVRVVSIMNDIHLPSVGWQAWL